MLAVVLCLVATLVSVYQVNYLLVLINDGLHTMLKRNMEHLVHSGSSRGARCFRGRVCKPRFWIRLGRTRTWWDNFVDDVVIPEEWRGILG